MTYPWHFSEHVVDEALSLGVILRDRVYGISKEFSIGMRRFA